MPFRTEASKTPTGNYLVAATCKGNPAHTAYKDQFHVGEGDKYSCPYNDCGHADVI